MIINCFWYGKLHNNTVFMIDIVTKTDNIEYSNNIIDSDSNNMVEIYSVYDIDIYSEQNEIIWLHSV